MRRTVVHYIDSAAFGGAERALGHLLSHHDRARWRSVLVYHPGAGLDPLLEVARQNDVELRAVPAMIGIAGGLRLTSFTRSLVLERTAVLHAHLTWALGCSWALLAAAALRVPARVATIQLFRASGAVGLPLPQRTIVPRTVHRYIAVSRHVRSELRRVLHVPDERITIVRNAVPASAAHPDRVRRDEARAALFPGERRPIVLTLARLESQKGLATLIAAAADLEDARFIVAGEGGLRRQLEAEVAARGISERVSFLGHRHDVPALLAAADLFVLPSLEEGLPLSVLEACSAGLPVIASDVGGTDEVIEDGVHGVLVPPADAGALAAAIRRLLSEPTLARRLSAAARERVGIEFAAAGMAQRVESIYEELLRG